MIVREPQSSFGPQAPTGAHAAVCVDEIDMGLMPNRFDPTQPPAPTVRIVWQLAEDQANGEPFQIHKDYRASLHEKAALRHDLESWRGRPFRSEELVGFDLEDVVGVHCLLNVVEKTSKKGTKFSNLAAIMPLPKSMIKIDPRKYVRMKDRPDPSNPQPQDEPMPFGEITDDDLPF